MSLIRIAWRLACVEALKGQTLAGDNVLDSEIGAIDLDRHGRLTSEQTKPFLAVYTDQASSQPDPSRPLLENGQTVLRIELGVTDRMTVTTEDEDGAATETIAGIPVTDGAFELMLDLLAAQVLRVLTGSSDFAEVFRGLSSRVTKLERLRDASAEGVRIAAQQIAITAELMPDPGTVDDLVDTVGLGRFLALAEAGSKTLQNTASLIRAAISGEGTDIAALQSMRGLTDLEAEALGYEDESDLAEISEVELAVGNTTTIVSEGSDV